MEAEGWWREISDPMDRNFMWGICESFVVRCLKGIVYSDDRTESDNTIEVTQVNGMGESNLRHIVR